MAWKLLKYLVAILIPATLLAQSHGETWKYDSSTQLSPYKSSVTNVDVPALTVNDNTYDATGWNGSFKVPTENSVRDKIEAMLAGGIDHGSLGGLSDDDHTQYHTDARALTWLGTRSTTDLAEGTNLYWTSARFDTAFGGKSTSDLSEGTNLYFSDERTQDAIGAELADTVTIDVTYTDATPELKWDVKDDSITFAKIQNIASNRLLGRSTAGSGDTEELTIGTGLSLSAGSLASTITQYTDEMAQDTVSSLIQNGTGISWSYNDPSNTLTPTVTLSPFSTTDLAEGTNLYYTAARFNSAFSGKSTSDLSEGTNLYFTDERAEDAVGGILTDSSSVDFTYNDGANTITAAVLPAGVDHNSLANLTTGDPHTQYTKKATLTAKGSIYAASAASTPAELAVGADGYVLTADSAQTTGIKWAAPTTGVTDHGALTGLSDDDHTQYALLAGRSGGQTLIGGDTSGDDLTLQSNSSSDGSIFLGSAQVSAFDESSGALCLGATSPTQANALFATSTGVTTSGQENTIRVIMSADPTSSSSSSIRAMDVYANLADSATTAVTGAVMGSRYLAGNTRQTGLLSSLIGLQLQAINGIVFGAASGTATSDNITAAIFQAINNSATTTATATVTGGQFTGENRGTNTIGAVTAGQFTVTNNNASATSTALRANWLRTSTVFGSSVTAGTVTNGYMLDSEGWPSGPTYTNTPEQIHLQAGATANIAIRQLGASNQNRFQGTAVFGADSTITSGLGVEVKDVKLGLTNTDNSARSIRFYEPSSSGSNYSSFKAQAQSGDVSYILPAADSSGTQYLRSDGSGNLSWGSPSGASPVALLDGSQHTDTLAGTVVRGDVIVGNSTPKWSRLAIGSSGKVLTSNGTDVSWQTPSTPTTTDILTPFGDDGCFTGGSGTSYFMSSISALCNTTESVVQMIIPYAMTVTRLYCYQSTDTSCHATFTARDDGANVTGATCSLTTTGQCDSGAISQAVASGSLIDIEVDETTGDCNSNSNTGCVLVFTH